MIVDKKDDFETVVVFRYWMPPSEDFEWTPKYGSWSVPSHIVKKARKLGKGILIALFPEVSDSYNEYDGNCFSYTQNEGHGQANIHWIQRTSIPASDEEIKPFKKYLEKEWGYRLVVRKRITRQMDDARHKNVRDINEQLKNKK